MKKKNEINIHDINSMASSTECTGLIKIIPDTEEEYDSYHDIYDYGPRPKDFHEEKKN